MQLSFLYLLITGKKKERKDMRLILDLRLIKCETYLAYQNHTKWMNILMVLLASISRMKVENEIKLKRITFIEKVFKLNAPSLYNHCNPKNV